MIKKGSYTSNFLILFSGGAAGQLVPFLFAPIIGRLFVEEEIAVMTNFLAIAGMIAIIAAGRYERAIVLPADKSRAMNLFALSVRLILIITLLSGITYLFRYEIETFYAEGQMADLMYLMIIAVPLYAFTALFTEWLIREKKFKSLTLAGVAKAGFGSMFTILFGYFSFGVQGLILGTIVGLFVALIMMYISAKSSLDFSIVSKDGMLQVAKEYKDFPLINSAHAFADILFGQFILYLVITRQFGLAELGLFSMMYRYLNAGMKAVGSSVGQLYYRDASERFSNGENVTVSFFRSIKLVAVFAVPVCLVILFFGPELFGLYLGENYIRSGELAQIMIVPLFINFLVSPVSGTPIIYRKQGTALILSLCAYAVGIVVLITGNYFGYDFYDSLKFYAASQTIYYLILFFWYLKLTRTAK